MDGSVRRSEAADTSSSFGRLVADPAHGPLPGLLLVLTVLTGRSRRREHPQPGAGLRRQHDGQRRVRRVRRRGGERLLTTSIRLPETIATTLLASVPIHLSDGDDRQLRGVRVEDRAAGWVELKDGWPRSPAERPRKACCFELARAEPPAPSGYGAPHRRGQPRGRPPQPFSGPVGRSECPRPRAGSLTASAAAEAAHRRSRQAGARLTLADVELELGPERIVI
jgi:hypothetical protein